MSLQYGPVRHIGGSSLYRSILYDLHTDIVYSVCYILHTTWWSAVNLQFVAFSAQVVSFSFNSQGAMHVHGRMRERAPSSRRCRAVPRPDLGFCLRDGRTRS
jgi:uncharacterized membrane protein